ncbi:MAG: DUF917 family protein [Armatimonadota bacterium]|nr:DUF917 family protein [Armatimonadota bacterium]MDR7426322.1 DUF917 family protein [Armatimonadota bacterium]MDR7463251.1 DUF917 family protein [Armatimonadota bacterium]MDR7469194.1 DUF917 family protein [Armatimonadota bacterium]MDR7474741.1 DUF917 family protein [Armatimonadota bacterium]
MKLRAEDIEPLVIGGALLGGGGGGDAEKGRRFAQVALSLGAPELVPLEALPPDATVVTVALVGSPAAVEQHVEPEDLARSLQLLQEAFGIRVDAINGNENGGFASTNGWVQSALLGIPIVDAPCNGRAHPTALMGAIGLHRVPGYLSRQAAAGGAGPRHLELTVSGSLEVASATVRQAAVQAGGVVAVARNPVDAAYLASHGAPGALAMARRVGEAMLAAMPAGSQAVWSAAAGALGGQVVDVGTVLQVRLETSGGFDRGTVTVRGARTWEITIWNEYMTLEGDGDREATFPDLIATLDERGMPRTSAELRQGMTVAILTAPQERLLLGAGARDPNLLDAAGAVVGKDLHRHTVR